MKLKSLGWFKRQWNSIQARAERLQDAHSSIRPVLSLIDHETGCFDALGFTQNGRLVRVSDAGMARISVADSVSVMRLLKRRTCRPLVDAVSDDDAEQRWLTMLERAGRRCTASR